MKWLQFISFTIHQLWKEFQAHHYIRKHFPTAQIEPNVTLKGPLENLILGKRVQIQSHTLIHLGGMAWCEGKGKFVLGDDSCISPNTTIYAAGPGGVFIGNNFDCGPGARIFASKTNFEDNHRKHQFETVRIGNQVTLFANVVISPGITIGDNVVVYAGSVVTKDIPANSIAKGIPAMVMTRSKEAEE